MVLNEYEIEKKVILLKLLLREGGESLEDALAALANTKMATLQRLKELLKELQDEGFVTKEGALTFIGEAEAKKAKEEFTLAD